MIGFQWHVQIGLGACAVGPQTVDDLDGILQEAPFTAADSLGKASLSVIPRLVLFAAFEGNPCLLCAIGDGQLYNFFHVDNSTGALTDRNEICLGTEPITVHSFRSNGKSHVFAASDRPTVICSAGKKLLCSNVNENELQLQQGAGQSHDERQQQQLSRSVYTAWRWPRRAP
ncbi:g1711 [Coccomyxa elongata]